MKYVLKYVIEQKNREKSSYGMQIKKHFRAAFSDIKQSKELRTAGCIIMRMIIISQYRKIYAYCAKIMLDFRKLLVVSYTLHYCGEVALLYPFLGNEAQRI